MGHLSSPSFSPPSPKPKQSGNRGKKRGNFIMLPQGPTKPVSGLLKAVRKSLFAHGRFHIYIYFFLQEIGNTFYCSMDIKTHYRGEFTICLRFLKHEISYFCSRPLQATFPDLCSQHLHCPPLLRVLQLKSTNTAHTAQNVGLKPWVVARKYRP